MKSKLTDILNIDKTVDIKLPSEDHMQKLIDEAKKLFEIMDKASATIRHLEENLQNLSANFPFKMEINKEEKSVNKKPEPYHDGLDPAIEGYYTQLYHYLAWGPAEENSKKFRLLLIKEEVETIYFQHPMEIEEYIFEKFQSKCIFKKPIIETEIETRINILKDLNKFISAFRRDLCIKRFIIEEADNKPQSP